MKCESLLAFAFSFAVAKAVASKLPHSEINIRSRKRLHKITRAIIGNLSMFIGLPIVKYIMDMHKGRLWIKSKEGVGTEVVVRLPAKK